MAAGEIELLIRMMARLPGLGPRSARRAVLQMLNKRESLMMPLADALRRAADAVSPCSLCGNLDASDPCAICSTPERDQSLLCIVEDVSDLWALERAGSYRGLYHVLGGTLSAIDGRGPEQLRIASLMDRLQASAVAEIIIALPATVDGQTTAHYLSERLGDGQRQITRLAHGVPVGGELDYLDDGTLTAALRARRPIG